MQKFTLLAGVRKSMIGLAVGLMMLLPSVIGFFFTAKIERAGLRQRVFGLTYIGRFLLVILLALVPSFFGLDNQTYVSYSYVVIMVLIALFYTFGNICNDSLIKESIPIYRFGQYVARVAAWAGLVSIVPGVIAAYFADKMTGLFPLQILLIAAAVTGAVITIPVAKGTDVAKRKADAQLSLMTPFRDKHYMRLLWISGLQTFFFVGTSSFWAFFMLEELKLSITVLVIGGAVCGLAAPVFSWVWGIVTDHFGARAAFLYSSFFMWLSCLVLVLPMPPLLCACLFCLLVGFYGVDGFFSRGRNLAGVALRNVMMPPGESTTYIGLAQLVYGVIGFFSGIVAGYVLELLGPSTIFGLSSYRMLFLMGNVVLGSVTVLLFFLIKERYPAGTNIRKLGLALITPTAFKDLFAIALVNNSDTMDALERRVKKLAMRSTYLGRTELLRNFKSPSIRVRRQAAKGLGFVEDDEALQTLIKEASLGDSPIVLECIEALETLGEEEAIRDLFANYSKMPKEVRMRLIIAALNLSSISFADLLKHVLLKESEMDIISEIILGLSHYGEWQIGLLALDRMQNHKLNREQTSKLWMAITKIFCRRVKALHLMSIENREPGSVVFGWKCMTNNTLYDAYLKENIEVF
ncbi:MAG: MFS transporter, partial [Lentisphaerae bacterium]|nr:MFS transporter [Lentisphaerota bacterium]